MSTPVNPNILNGFKAVGTLTGAPLNLQQAKFATAAADGVALYPGDAIKLTGATDANGFLIVARAAAGDVPLVGVMSGVVPDGTDLTIQYRKASTTTYIYATVDPNTIYEVQANAAVALADAGKTCSLVSTNSGTALTGISGMQIDQSTLTTNTASFAFKSLGFSQLVGNIPNSTYNRLYVKINNHAYAPSGVAGV
jgi:hypothetical protein